jgi:hypothetical protein
MSKEQDSVDSAQAPPNELMGPLPRTVRLSGNNAGYLVSVVLIAIIFCGIGWGWYIFDTVNELRHRAALRIHGQEAIAEITAFHVGRGGESTMDYVFAVQGKAHRSHARMPSSSGRSFHEADHIAVLYLPTNPTVNHPKAWEWSIWMGLDKMIFVLFFTVMGGVALLLLFRDRKLAREGLAAPAVVSDCTYSNREFRLQYSFRTQAGQLITGKGGSREKYELGAVIWILYLPRKPRRNHPYPLSSCEITNRSSLKTAL